MSPVTEAKRITDFFLLLGEDQSLLAAFERDPRSALEVSGLDEDQVATVLAGDPEAVRAAVENEIARDPTHRCLVIAPRMMIFTKTEPDEEQIEGEPEPEPPSEPEPSPEPEPEPDESEAEPG